MVADVSVDIDSGCNSVVVTGLTVSRGAGSVTVVITSATAAEVVVIAANLNQCHDVFLFASYEVIISYVGDQNVSILKQIIMVRELNYTPLYTPTFHHQYPLGSEAIGYVPPNIFLILKLIELVRMHIIQSSVSQHTLYLIMQMIIIDR